MRILHFNIVDSTQNIASDLIDNNIGDVLVLADTQTKGRGRLNERTWVSLKGNFHGSFIVDLRKLGFQENSLAMLNIRTLDIIKNFIQNQTKQTASIKYPNDILLDGLKIAGALIEVCFPKAIIGIGLNTAAAPIKGSTKLNIDNKLFAHFFYKKLHENSSTY